jgi:formate dehydrogenase (coenzyme F420) beta subunit
MIEKIRDKVKELLDTKKIEGFLGLAKVNGHTAPFLFKNVDELENLTLGDNIKPGDARYPLAKILTSFYKKYPELTFGVLARGCDERAINALCAFNQLNTEKLVLIGISCPKELAKACECEQPFPDDLFAGEKTEKESSVSVEKIDGFDLTEKFDFWHYEFSKCVKCYGCRNICPMCFCNKCTLESEELISKGSLPVDMPAFHLVRAMHMADKCIDCGLCEEACPVDIPLRTLYKKTNQIMFDDFGFKSGESSGQTSPLTTREPSQKINNDEA